MTRKTRARIKVAWQAKDKLRRAQLITSAAIVTAVAVSYLCNYVFPDFKAYAPLAGLAASMLWIWAE